MSSRSEGRASSSWGGLRTLRSSFSKESSRQGKTKEACREPASSSDGVGRFEAVHVLDASTARCDLRLEETASSSSRSSSATAGSLLSAEGGQRSASSFGGAGSSSARPSAPRREVAHVRQKQVWDCGLACVLMVLSAAPRPRADATWEALHATCGTRSVWTIDLAFVLKALGVTFVFATKTCGCDPSYKDMSFYRRELSLDERRVAALFARAFDGEIQLRRATMPPDALEDLLLSKKVLVIALVDLRYLYRTSAVGRAVAALPWSYTGHYIVLVGVDAKGRVLYRDPASTTDEHAIHLNDLHKARTAHGTDEDLILISVDSLDAPPPPPTPPPPARHRD